MADSRRAGPANTKPTATNLAAFPKELHQCLGEMYGHTEGREGREAGSTGIK